MLKHRYNNLSESVSDFNRMLDGMNKIQPLERSYDEDLMDFFRDEQALVRLEQQIEHVHRAIFGSGMPISESEIEGLKQIHAHAAATYDQAANKAREKIKAMSAAHDKERLEKMKELHARFRRKAQEHTALAKPPEKKAVVDSVNESVQPRANAALKNFRALAGIEERVMMPRDPGVSGTTRFNSGYEEMAKPFTEAKEWSDAKIAAHKKKVKADVKTIERAADDIDREHSEDVEEAKKWAGAAVKRPGRLHKYFGIPEDQKIPMSKIKAAYNKLKDKEDKSAEEVSLMRALALGIRFKGGDVPGGEKKKGLAGNEDAMAATLPNTP